MGCKGINNDSTEEYVDSYSKTALQQADIIMDGIQSGNCEEIADIFVHILRKSSRAANRYKNMDEIY